MECMADRVTGRALPEIKLEQKNKQPLDLA